MKVVLLSTGKTFQGFVSEGCELYEKRLKRYMPFEHQVLPDVKNASKLPMEALKDAEGRQILSAIKPGDHLVLLDEHGREYSSFEFARWVEKRFQDSSKRLVFAVGGSFGFSADVHAHAQESIALSKLTFSHQMVRLIFEEQLYRAMTILRNEPYHNE